MKRVAKPVFFIVALLILFLFITATFGIKVRNGDNTTTYIKGVNDIRWGIDINGGVEATFTPATSTKATKAQIDSARSIIEVRLNTNHITDYELYTDYNTDRIIVRFPWKSDQKTFNPEDSIKELSATALLTFREGNSHATTTTDADGESHYKTPTGDTAKNIILQGADVQSAKSEMTTDQTSGKTSYEVSLVLSDSGTKKFADATEKMQGKIISIWMDDVCLSDPTVNTVIPDGKCVIEGNFTAAKASQLANQINAGALPFKLTTTSFSTVSPTLGSSSLYAMLIAGVISFLLLCVFMLYVFRLPGFVACVSLLGHIGISFAAISGYFGFINSFTMTLPGIAGLILTVGMGVDANIITDCRIKEELWAGKTLDGAIQKGDEHSFWAIFDGNITVVIVGVILMGVFGPSNILSAIFGASVTGAIYSFGYTLLVGIVGNFLFGIASTRLMTKSLSGYKFARNKWLYGGPKE
ncbi:MAG TPA: protein translocase subunit SecD [Caproiciproducens sp.]|nr:protein translocase subunit SecD [Caproiciproducens sp.]